MPRSPLALLLPMLLLVAAKAQAQTAPTPARPANEVAVTVPVPRALVLVGDCVRVLFSRSDGQDKLQELLARRRARINQPEGVSIKLPKNQLTRSLGLGD